MIQTVATEGFTRFKIISPLVHQDVIDVCTKQVSHSIIPGSPYHICAIDSAVSHSAIKPLTQITV